MRERFFIVNAFSEDLNGGNPAAVCVLQTPVDRSWMQHCASTLGFSETAFLLRQGENYRLRWFSPSSEVDLCGHATLAAAYVLWREGHLALDSMAAFDTRSGRLTASNHDGWIELDFPSDEVRIIDAPGELISAANGEAICYGKSRFDYLIEFASSEMICRYQPDLGLIEKLAVRGLIITSRGSRPFDFISRFFSPQLGIPEDPVTGSAHCALGPYWADKLKKNELLARQASERGGIVKIQCKGKRLILGGKAVYVRDTDL